MGIPKPPFWMAARWVIKLHAEFGERDGSSTSQPLSGALFQVESGVEKFGVLTVHPPQSGIVQGACVDISGSLGSPSSSLPS